MEERGKYDQCAFLSFAHSAQLFKRYADQVSKCVFFPFLLFIFEIKVTRYLNHLIVCGTTHHTGLWSHAQFFYTCMQTYIKMSVFEEDERGGRGEDNLFLSVIAA